MSMILEDRLVCFSYVELCVYATGCYWQSSKQRAGGRFSCAEGCNTGMIVRSGMRRRYVCGKKKSTKLEVYDTGGSVGMFSYVVLCVYATRCYWQSMKQRAGGRFSCAVGWNTGMIVHRGMRRRYGCGCWFYGFVLRKNQPNKRSMILEDRLLLGVDVFLMFWYVYHIYIKEQVASCWKIWIRRFRLSL